MTTQMYASGAAATESFGSLRVAVPELDHPSRTRSSALMFARSVFGPQAALTHRGLHPITLCDVYGKNVTGREYNVVIVGTLAERDAAIFRLREIAGEA